MDKKYTIAVAGTGDGDIIGTTKKNHVKSRLLALDPDLDSKFLCREG